MKRSERDNYDTACIIVSGSCGACGRYAMAMGSAWTTRSGVSMCQCDFCGHTWDSGEVRLRFKIAEEQERQRLRFCAAAPPGWTAVEPMRGYDAMGAEWFEVGARVLTTEGDDYLIGDINVSGSACHCCTFIDDPVEVIAYKPAR